MLIRGYTFSRCAASTRGRLIAREPFARNFYTYVQILLRIAQSRVYSAPQRATYVLLRQIPVAITEYLVGRHATRVDQVNGEYLLVQVIDQVELRLLEGGLRFLPTHFKQFLKTEHEIPLRGNRQSPPLPVLVGDLYR